MTVIIICTAEPVAVPACRPNSPFHFSGGFLYFLHLRVIAAMLSNASHFLTCQYKQSRDKYAFSYFAIFVCGCLERLTGGIGKAIQIQTIIPIRTTDER